MKKTKIILDCDTGIDDAIALIMALNNPSIDLLGVTSVKGNAPLLGVVKNNIDVMQWVGYSAPVYKGCCESIIGRKVTDSNFHGKDSLAELDYPATNIKPQKQHAVDYIIETLSNAQEKITLVVTGPMTNIALALRLCPSIKNNIDKIVMMGGTPYLGNVTPAAEFNIFLDPEAAHICFSSGLSIYMIGFDITTKTKCYPSIIERMKKMDNAASDLFAQIMQYYNMTQKATLGFEGAALNDPHTIAFLIDPSFLTFEKMHVGVDISGGPSIGRTNCDIYHRTQLEENANVAVDVDVEKFWDIIEQSLKQYG